MSITDYLILWPEMPALSVLLWLVIAVVFLYFARIPAHQAIKSLTLAINRAMRLASRSVLKAEERLERRNRDVLLAAGCDAVERSIEREFHRVDAVVRRDLSGYPAINRKLNDLVTLIDNDYGQCAEVPPAPSEWVKAVETVAKIRATGDSQVAKMLGDIKGTLDDQHKGAMEEYRKSSARRHEILKKTAPYWRELTQTLNKVGGTIKGITERSSVIDKKLSEFDMIRSGSDKAARTLATSSVTQFVVAGLVLLIAIGGAAINFNLIALPMSEMVGGGSYIGPYKTSSIAAMVIIMVEVAMGLYLMEALRITNLFPVIGSMNDKTRTRMIWITFSILFILASVEASLAYMRDQIAADMQSLRQSLAATGTVQPVNSWIPTAGQMVMGFILPFALTFVAIPLESFIHSSRTVIGVMAAWSLRVLAFSLRLTGGVIKGLGNVIVALYDLVVFPPLWVERLIREKAHNNGHNSTEERIR
jgi:hypothetical protein